MARRSTSDLLWNGPVAARRGPRPELSLEAITDAAVRIADGAGFGALSMQAVADALGFTKMSLYRHVTSKEELVAVMTERAFRHPPTVESTAGWRDHLEAWVELLSQRWSEHPWLPAAAAGDRVMGPNEMAWIESVLAAMSDLLLTASERIDVAFLLSGHVRNTQSLDSAGTHPWNDPKHRTLLNQRRDDFAATLSVMDASVSADFGRAFGLELILDGVERLHMSRQSAAPAH